MREGLLKATVTTEANVVVVRLHGEIDSTIGSMLAELLDAAVEVGRPTIALDTRDVSFVDLRGLDVLIEAQDRARTRGVQIVLRSPAKHVLELLLLTGRDNVFPIDLTDAAVIDESVVGLMERMSN